MNDWIHMERPSNGAATIVLDTIVCASPDGVFDACSLPVCFGYICLTSCLCLLASTGMKATIFNVSFFSYNQSINLWGAKGYPVISSLTNEAAAVQNTCVRST